MNFDTGSIVNWVQLGIWLYIALAYFQPNLMAKIKIPPMSRDKLIPALICAGIIFSGYSLYAQYLKEPSWEITEVVSGKTFVNETLKMDGRGFNRCIFENVTFEYEGTGPTYCRYCDLRGKNYVSTKSPLVGTSMDLMKLIIDNPHTKSYSFGAEDEHGNKFLGKPYKNQ